MRSNASFAYLAIIVGTLAISLDFASVDLALPALERQFGLNLTSVQWIINGYVLAFSGLMVAGGRLADAHGRKRILLLGMGIFALASLLGGLAGSGGMVIACRVLQGVGAAMLWPAMIGLGSATAGPMKQNFILGLIFGTCSLGNAAGPIVGGALTEWLSWRWVLWINVPMALFSMLITAWKVPPDPHGGKPPRMDYPGMFALTAGLVALMLFVYQLHAWGWNDWRNLGLLAAAAGLLGLFPRLERRVTEAFIPPDLMRNRELQVLCLSALVICQLFFVVLLYFTQYAMKFLGEDPVRAGARVVLFMISYGIVSYFGGPLNAYFGTRRLLVGGLAAASLASFSLGLFGPGAPGLIFHGSLTLLGLGVGAVIPTVSARAIETAGTTRASLVSGITFMCQLSGAALMIAINTALFSAVGSNRLDRLLAQDHLALSPAQRDAVADVMVGAHTIRSLPPLSHRPPALDDIGHLVVEAYQDGLRAVLWLSAGLVIAALFLVWRFVPKKLEAEVSPRSPQT